jgi:hypothetical protein
VCRQKFASSSDLLKHVSPLESGHIREFPGEQHWDQPEYYFSTFEDDSLLCLLDDAAYSKDECKIKVIPEEMDIKVNSDLLKNLHELTNSPFS